MMKRFVTVFLAFMVIAGLAFAGERLQGYVNAISDGDTFSAMVNGAPTRIRLYGVDCPEGNQKFGSEARTFTFRAINGKDVEIEQKAKDQYGRIVALVYYDGKCLNAELLKAGLAWHYKQYSKEKEFADLENEARKAGRGLWVDKKPTSPWNFRRGEPDTADSGSVRAQFSGNAKSQVFHRQNCKHYACKNCTVKFSSRDEAVKAGYKPCGLCKP